MFDAAVNNTDRKAGHLLPVPGGHVYGVDHGVTFSPVPKLRTVLWGWRGEPFRDAELDVLRGLRAGLDGGARGDPQRAARPDRGPGDGAPDRPAGGGGDVPAARSAAPRAPLAAGLTMAGSTAALDALRVRIDGLRAAADYAGAHDVAAAAVAGDAVDRGAALVELGRCAADLGRIDEAETAWRDAVRLAGAGGEAVRAAAGAELALLALRDGMREEAEALADAAILQAASAAVPDPDVALALVAAALVLMAVDRADEAGRRIEAAAAGLDAGDGLPVGSRAARAEVAVAGARASLVRVAGDAESAVAALEAAERLADARLGASCIEVAALAAERAAALRRSGRSADAEAAYRTALARFAPVGRRRAPRRDRRARLARGARASSVATRTRMLRPYSCARSSAGSTRRARGAPRSRCCGTTWAGCS